MSYIKRMNIVLVDLPEVGGSVQHGKRACLVAQNDRGNFYAPTCIVIPFTKVNKKSTQPTHIIVPKSEYNSLEQDSMLLFEQPITIDKKRICHYIGRLEGKYNKRVDKAIMVSLGVEIGGNENE